MADAIDLDKLRDAIDVVLDHLINDFRITTVVIDESSDHYWHCPASELNDMSKKPSGLDVGRLSDDVDFVKLITRGEAGDVSYNLVHVAPLLRYIGEKIKK